MSRATRNSELAAVLAERAVYTEAARIAKKAAANDERLQLLRKPSKRDVRMAVAKAKSEAPAAKRAAKQALKSGRWAPIKARLQGLWRRSSNARSIKKAQIVAAAKFEADAAKFEADATDAAEVERLPTHCSTGVKECKSATADPATSADATPLRPHERLVHTQYCVRERRGAESYQAKI